MLIRGYPLTKDTGRFLQHRCSKLMPEVFKTSRKLLRSSKVLEPPPLAFVDPGLPLKLVHSFLNAFEQGGGGGGRH